jgi:hypothetical protein
MSSTGLEKPLEEPLCAEVDVDTIEAHLNARDHRTEDRVPPSLPPVVQSRAKEVERMKLIHMPDPDDRLFDFRTMAEHPASSTELRWK